MNTAASHPENQYLDMIRRILDEGVQRTDRTGTGTLAVFGHQMRFDLQAGFPLVTAMQSTISQTDSARSCKAIASS